MQARTGYPKQAGAEAEVKDNGGVCGAPDVTGPFPVGLAGG